MASTEDIEAKLCAYIEGILDPADKAEIERHLEANPHHRALLGELGKTRQYVQTLPRESAPDEILEAVQSQLERSALLQDPSEVSRASRLRINRWPQLLATAAVLLLTVGLGAIIYFVLPRSSQSAREYALTPPVDSSTTLPVTTPMFEPVPSAGLPLEVPRGERAMSKASAAESADVFSSTPAALAAPSPLPAPSPEFKKQLDSVVEQKSEATRSIGKSGPTDYPALAGNAFGINGGAGIDFEAARDQLANADLARQLRQSSGGLKNDAVFVVVTSGDAKATRGQVTDYLVSNKIRYEEVPQAAPQPLDISPSQEALMARQRPLASYQFEKDAAAADRVQDQSATSTSESDVSDKSKQQMPAETAPSDAAVQPEAPLTVAVDGQSAVQQQEAPAGRPELQLQQQQSAIAIPVTDLPQELIVARSMTRTQAARLKESLINQTSVARAMLYPRPVGSEETDQQQIASVGYYSRLNSSIGRYAGLPKALETDGDSVAIATAPARPSAEVGASAEVANDEPALDASEKTFDAAAHETTDVVIVVKDLPPDQAAQQMQIDASEINSANAVGTDANAAPTAPETPATSAPATLPAELKDAAP